MLYGTKFVPLAVKRREIKHMLSPVPAASSRPQAEGGTQMSPASSINRTQNCQIRPQLFHAWLAIANRTFRKKIGPSDSAEIMVTITRRPILLTIMVRAYSATRKKIPYARFPALHGGAPQITGLNRYHRRWNLFARTEPTEGSSASFNN